MSVRFNTSTQNLRFRLSAHVLDAPMDPGERDLGVVGLFFSFFFSLQLIPSGTIAFVHHHQHGNDDDGDSPWTDGHKHAN